MDEEKIKEILEENAKLKEELQSTKEHKMLDREARTPCVFSNFVFHHI